MFTFLVTLSTVLLFIAGAVYLSLSASFFDSMNMTEGSFRNLVIAIALAATFFLASLTLHDILM
ncbi:MAG: hypothetical protein WCT16_05025 [Candidatus Buchananbacteria bacterium]